MDNSKKNERVAYLISKIKNEVLKRQRLGILPESTAIRVDITGAYELVANIDPDTLFVSYYRNYFFTTDEIITEPI